MRVSTSSAGGTQRRRGIDGGRRLAGLLLAALIGAFLAACSSFSPIEERRRLAQAKAQWNAHGYDDYEFMLGAICGECSQYTLRIRVRGGQITEVFDNGVPVPPDYRTHTVPGLFTMIRGWLDDNPYSFHADYDAALGYPAYASYGDPPTVADGGWGFAVYGLQPLPALPAPAP